MYRNRLGSFQVPKMIAGQPGSLYVTDRDLMVGTAAAGLTLLLCLLIRR